MKKLVLALFIVLVMVPMLVVLNALVTQTIWGWFAVPLFGLPPLSLAYAFGLTLVVSCFVHDTTNRKAEGIEDAIQIMTLPFGRNAIILLLGWIVKHFI